jgi:hypothetical protein
MVQLEELSEVPLLKIGQRSIPSASEDWERRRNGGIWISEPCLNGGGVGDIAFDKGPELVLPMNVGI